MVLVDEEEKIREMGWNVAMSKPTLVQLATCAATGVAEPLLGTCDAYWVATLGTTALAALGPNTCVYSSIIAVIAAHGFGTAATRIMAVAIENDERARRTGVLASGELTGAGKSIIACVVTAVGFGAICSLIIALFPAAVVNAVGVDSTVVPSASGYMRIRALGVPAVCLIAVLGGAFQAARDAKTPMLAVLLAGSCNLVLDPSMIFLFGLGFNGAAWATVIAQYSEAALMVWYAFFGPRRVNFFGESRREEDLAEEEDLAKEEDLVKEGDGETETNPTGGEASVALDGSNPLTYGFEKKLAWKFGREAFGMIGRVMNVVVVWGATSALATRIGVAQSAAHVLLFQIICIISIAAGALTTVSNAVTSRLQVSEGDSAASGAGRALSVLGGAVFVVIAGCFWAIRVPLVTNFTKDAAVVGHALEAYPIVMLCVLTYWYKALEGALIGRGDAKSVNGVFTFGGIVCTISLWLFKQQNGALTVSSIWWSLLFYYLALAAGMLMRWVQLDGGAKAFGLKRWKTTPAAPVDEEVLVYHEPETEAEDGEETEGDEGDTKPLAGDEAK